MGATMAKRNIKVGKSYRNMDDLSDVVTVLGVYECEAIGNLTVCYRGISDHRSRKSHADTFLASYVPF